MLQLCIWAVIKVQQAVGTTDSNCNKLTKFATRVIVVLSILDIFIHLLDAPVANGSLKRSSVREPESAPCIFRDFLFFSGFKLTITILNRAFMH